jgi:hypothetical protein
MNLLEKIKITRVQLFNEEQDMRTAFENAKAENCLFAQQALSEIIEWAEENHLSVEEMIWKMKFPDEEFNGDDFYDWAAENSREAFRLCLDVANKLNKLY